MTSYFFNPGLLAGAALVSLPIIIHLLHRLRTRRIRWAAIDFLLESEKRNRRRLLFEQLLLLALRCLLVLLFVFIVARPKLGRDLSSLLAGGQRTEHIIVLDDSYSMAQQVGQRLVFDHATELVHEIAQRLSESGGEHYLTVLRTSLANQPPDVASQRVDAATGYRLRSLVEQWSASHLAMSPAAAIDKAAKLFEQSDATSKVVYVVSDYRSKDWQDEQLPAALRELADDVEIRLVDVATQESPNLTIDAVEVPASSLAVGVPFPVTVRVRNHSDRPMQNLSVEPFVDDKPLAARILETVPPRSTGQLQVQVTLPAAGPHDVRFRVSEDALLADNQRSLTINLADEIPVLIIDDSVERIGSKFLALSLAPGGDVQTGLSPEIHGSDRLTSDSLDRYRVIFLADFATLTPAQVAVLDRHVQAGGGLGIFLGSQFDPQRATSWLGAEENALVPVAIGPPVDLPSQPDADQWTVNLNHPVFEIFEGDRNPFLRTVQFQRAFSTPPVSELPDSVRVIAQSNQAVPLALDASVGDGRVFLLLSSCGPEWNNWCRNPSFVVSMLELHAYLAEPSAAAHDFFIGESWIEEFPLTAYRRRVEFSLPTAGQPFAAPQEKLVIEGELQGTGCHIQFEQTRTPGAYRLAKTRTDGTLEMEGRSYNVQPQEGDLRKITPESLRQSLPGLTFEYFLAEGFGETFAQARVEPRDWLLAAFVLILFAEQWLAWRLSYHLA